MYAIVRTGGKQYRVEEGAKIRVEKIDGEIGSDVALSEILLIGGKDTKIGTPLVDGAKVSAKIARQGKGKKIRVFKRRRRKGFKKSIGHRQDYTELEITGIAG